MFSNYKILFGHLMSIYKDKKWYNTYIYQGGFMRALLNSSNISEAIYHPHSKILEVCFHSGHVYRYTGVPNYIFQELIGADSAGRFYNKRIKGKFSSMRWF